MKLKPKQQSGGIHPLNFKWMTQDQAIQSLPWPDKVTIPIKQHQGPLPEVIVKVGQKVQVGDVLAKANHARSVNVHASISGEIINIQTRSDEQDVDDVIIVIKKKEPVKFVPLNKSLDQVLTQSNDVLINELQAAGVVGLGGALFPTHLKLSIPEDKSIDTIIINGAECEPYINADYRLMVEQSAALVQGIQLVSKIIAPKQIVLAVEAHHAQALQTVQAAAQDKIKLNVKLLPVSYPQGDESILIKSITSKEVPVGGLPWDVGAVVVNINTVIAIKQALLNGQPVINRIVSVAGAGVKQPKNIQVPIGTPIQDLFNACGGLLTDTAKILIGGPMMGISRPDPLTPVTKATNGVIALLDQDIAVGEKDQPCIRCGRCVDACPFGLQPELMFKAVRKGKLKKAKDNYLFSCRVCGCCDYVCPARIPLAEIFREGKLKIKSRGNSYPGGHK